MPKLKRCNAAALHVPTNEHDIAEFAKRIIFRDGTMRRDDRVQQRPRAAEVLRTMPRLED